MLILLGTVISCKTDADCDRFFVCKAEECVHKPLFPMAAIEILGCCLIFITSGLANASGAGGGALFVVYFMVIFGLNASDAVAIAQANVLSGCFAAFFIKLFHRHPTKDKPVIDYDILLLTISPVLIGTSIGVIINIILPHWVIILCLVVLVAYLSIGMAKKGIKTYKIESIGKAMDLQKIAPAEDCEKTEGSENLKVIYSREQRYIPYNKLPVFFLVFILACLASFIRGSRSFGSIVGLEFCSTEYWITSIIVFLIFLSLFTLSAMLTMRDYKYKIQNKYKFDTYDMKWSTLNSGLVGLAGFGAGFFGAVIGVGGAMVLAPALVKFNVRPEVITASSTSMIVFSSAISTLQFATAGKIDLDYGLFTAAFSFLGSIIGVFVIKNIVEKYRRSSLIIFAVFITMVISSTSAAAYGIYISLSSGTDFGAHSYCN